MIKLSRNNILCMISYALVSALGFTYLQYSLTSKATSFTNQGVNIPLNKRKTESIESVGLDGAIPKQLFFTYKHNILTTKQPSHLYNNVWDTIDSYRTVWGDPNATVHFMDDEKCVEAIKEAVPSDSEVLLNFFHSQPGVFKGDICRVVALYLHGGYYFDVDLQVIEPYVAPDDTYFVTVRQPEMGLFQAFIASTPRHPILRKNIEKLVSLAKHELFVPFFVGSETMKMAYDESPELIKKSSKFLLEARLGEGFMDRKRYDMIARQNGEGRNCNWVVVDPKIYKVYFYSRMVGAGYQCNYKSRRMLEWMRVRHENYQSW